VPPPAALTVVSVAYALAPVRPDGAGGAEQVLRAVDRALVAAGHRSVVVAVQGSQVAGALAAVPAPPAGRALDDATGAAQHARVRDVLAATLAGLARAGTPADLVHFHGIDVLDVIDAAAAAGRPVPALVTLHLPPAWYPAPTWSLGDPNGPRPATWLHCVSDAQHRACPAGARLLPPVANGVRVSAGAPAARRHGYALCLGRVCPEKGYHLAAHAAARAGVPLLVAGQLFAYEAHVRYWERELCPLMGRGRARFVGTVDPARKRRLLEGARCVVVPSLVDETSSLVAMEAAAAGTPVVALRRGALPEVVEHGRTGWLADDADGLADGIARAGAIDRDACWATARARFDERRMTAAYLARFAELAAAPWVPR
jgi:glycosyltransferase involved in cell wall biosynthesis